MLPKAIDVRCAGYVIAPGCILPDGREYRLIRGSLQSIPLLPIPLQEALKASRKTTTKTSASNKKHTNLTVATAPEEPTNREFSYAAKALAGEKQILAATDTGERNNQLGNPPIN